MPLVIGEIYVDGSLVFREPQVRLVLLAPESRMRLDRTEGILEGLRTHGPVVRLEEEAL